MPALATSTRSKLAYVVLAATDTWLAARPAAPAARRARFLTKPLLMPLLAGSLATDPEARTSPLRTTTLVAQAGGWGGDVALLGHGTKPFLVGAGSFAVGHTAYLTGFVRHRARTPLRRTRATRVVAGAWLLTAPVMAVMAGRQHPELAGPVLGYATFLAAMTSCAGHLDPALPRPARRLTAAGAGLFMLSDTLLGFGKFVLSDPPRVLEAAVMASYTAGQLLLSEGAARA